MNWLKNVLVAWLSLAIGAATVEEAEAQRKSPREHGVRGHYRNGSYVRPHRRGSGAGFGARSSAGAAAAARLRGSYDHGLSAGPTDSDGQTEPQLEMVDCPSPPRYASTEADWQTASFSAAPTNLPATGHSARPVVRTIDARRWRRFADEFISTAAQGRAVLAALEAGMSPEDVTARFFRKDPASDAGRYTVSKVREVIG